MKKLVCPECGCEDFEIGMTVEDTLIYSCNVFEDGSYETNEYIKDYCGETQSVSDSVECRKCGRQYDRNDLAANPAGSCKDMWS